MGQKINPIANRLGIIRGWDSNWYGGSNFGENILEDNKIRAFLDARFKSYIEKPGRNSSKKEFTSVYEYISRIVIERTPKLVTITICTSRPGMIIGQGGKDVELLKAQLQKITGKDVQINIFEIKKSDIDANIVGKSVARQIEGKMAYRRAIKKAIENAMRGGAEGIKIQISGRLNGAEIARSEMYKEGRTPLHTFRADIDYCQCEALTKVGILGIKVWICRGEVYGKKDLAPNFTPEKETARREGGRREGGRREGRSKRNSNR